MKVAPSQVKSRVHRDSQVIKAGHKFYQNAARVDSQQLGVIAPVKTAQAKATQVIPVWRGQTCYIIGGGPSLIDFNWSLLAGKNTIAINKAVLTYPNADVLYWTDNRFYTWHQKEINEFRGLKYALLPARGTGADVNLLNRGKRFGLETRQDTLAHGNNSGYAAINLAFHLGAARIVLLGYDMGNANGRSHFHDGYPIRATGDEIYEKQFIPGFKQLADELKRCGVEVWNANLESKLTAFPKISLDRALLFS